MRRIWTGRSLAIVVGLAGLQAEAVEVAGGSVRIELDEGNRGAITRMVTAGGYDFTSSESARPLFTLRLVRANDFAASTYVRSCDAKTFSVERRKDGVTLVYGGLGEAVERVACRVTANGGDGKVRFRIAALPKAGWKLAETHYPTIGVAERLGTRGEDDAIVGGTAKGGIIRNPSGKAANTTVFWGRSPGNLACSFVTWYDDARLLYFAAEDGTGGTKDLSVTRRKNGLEFSCRRFGWDSDGVDFGYDVVLTARAAREPYREGTGRRMEISGDCSWQDAADIYRDWAEKQRWCKARLRDRADLPAWLKDAPAMVRFYRHHFKNPDLARRWIEGYWNREFRGVPLIAAMWGWEHRETWCSDYFPCCPNDAAFTALVKDLKRNGAHAFPWPSGYHWSLMQGQRDDGTFAYDDRARFEKIAAPHAVWKADGKIYDRNPGWLQGGHLACMCPGDPWSMNWFNRDVSLELARRGCELVQVDQVVGGAFPECWAKNHPHPPGDGPWKVEVFRRQLETMREAMREAEPGAVVCFEEPCDVFNDLIGLQDYRDCEAQGEWASVFNYVYHAYVPCFQSNLVNRGDRRWLVHCAVDGQMPFFGWPTEGDSEINGLAMGNGDFETVDADGQSFTSWETAAATHHIDRAVRHGGKAALRLETPNITNHIQVARNISLDTADFTPGRTYRLSAWLKTETRGAWADVCYGLFTPGFKASRKSDVMQFPKPEEGWVRRESTFVMPDEGDLTLRFMINAGRGVNKVWIDDVKFEEVAADGTAKDARLSGRGAYHRFMAAWVRLYRGEGRAFLAEGRHVRPPRLWSGEGVHAAAYEAADGRRALVLGNATVKPQVVAYETAHGARTRVTLAGDELRLVELP